MNRRGSVTPTAPSPSQNQLPSPRNGGLKRRASIGFKLAGKLAEGIVEGTKETEQRVQQMQHDIRHDAMMFSEYDMDGNAGLDFEEFLAMQPRRMREMYAPTEIRALFTAADADNDGHVSVNEFFRWSASHAAEFHGAAALGAAFRRFDKDGTGQLTASEFEPVAAALGYGNIAKDIFRELDTDNSKTISYVELTNAFSLHPPPDLKAKQLLTAMMWAKQDAMEEEAREGKGGGQGHRVIDTSRWVIQGKTAKAVRAELQALLRQSGGYVGEARTARTIQMPTRDHAAR